MDVNTTPKRRLQAVADHTITARTPSTPFLILPDGAQVDIIQAKEKGAPNGIVHTGREILTYTVDEERKLAFDLSSINTRFEGNTTHIPKYSLLTLCAPRAPTQRPQAVSLAQFWISAYALFTLYHAQENIPVSFTSLPNATEIRHYLLTSGLARTYPASRASATDAKGILFLSRATFWQGAGTSGYHDQPFWLLNPTPVFPPIASYTRNERVIATHPLRPAKPQPGEMLYRRWCSALGETLDITYFDLEGLHDGSKGRHEGGVSRHLAAFHRWHNNERVSNAWGERGTIEEHKAYVEGLLADPHALPCMLSWNGELMGYVEIVYTKEDHAAQHYPQGVIPGEWERGIHVLAGENKFLGNGRSEIWIRCLCHYIFLADPRTERVIGEPDHRNLAIARVADEAGFIRQTVFDFPYKRSLMVLNPRERFFTLCRLW